AEDRHLVARHRVAEVEADAAVAVAQEEGGVPVDGVGVVVAEPRVGLVVVELPPVGELADVEGGDVEALLALLVLGRQLLAVAPGLAQAVPGLLAPLGIAPALDAGAARPARLAEVGLLEEVRPGSGALRLVVLRRFQAAARLAPVEAQQGPA